MGRKSFILMPGEREVDGGREERIEHGFDEDLNVASAAFQVALF